MCKICNSLSLSFSLSLSLFLPHCSCHLMFIPLRKKTGRQRKEYIFLQVFFYANSRNFPPTILRLSNWNERTTSKTKLRFESRSWYAWRAKLAAGETAPVVCTGVAGTKARTRLPSPLGESEIGICDGGGTFPKEGQEEEGWDAVMLSSPGAFPLHLHPNTTHLCFQEKFSDFLARKKVEIRFKCDRVFFTGKKNCAVLVLVSWVNCKGRIGGGGGKPPPFSHLVGFDCTTCPYSLLLPSLQDLGDFPGPVCQGREDHRHGPDQAPRGHRRHLRPLPPHPHARLASHRHRRWAHTYTYLHISGQRI